MKKLIFCLCFTILAAGICFSQARGSTMYVAVRTTDLRTGTGIFAGRVETLKQGDAITVVGENGKWLQVRSASNKTGWAAKDNFTARRVIASGSATASEVALAGKGFSAEAEVAYSRDGGNFRAVDEVEKNEVPLDVLERFINNGRLRRGE